MQRILTLEPKEYQYIGRCQQSTSILPTLGDLDPRCQGGQVWQMAERVGKHWISSASDSRSLVWHARGIPNTGHVMMLGPTGKT